MKNIQRIDSQKNKLKQIQENTFKLNINLLTIDLSFNLLESFTENDIKKLQQLNIEGNDIKTIVELKCPNLNSLIIRNNNLKQLNDYSLRSLNNLRNLSLVGIT